MISFPGNLPAAEKPSPGARAGFLRKNLPGLIPLILLPLAWHLLAKALDTPLLPPPGKVLQNIAARTGWLPHLAASLRRIGAGMLLAVAAGLPLGIAAAGAPPDPSGSGTAGPRLSPAGILSVLCTLGYPIPKVVLLPPLVLLLGIGEAPKVLLIFLVLVFPVMVSVRDALAALPEARFTALRSLGVPAYRRFPNIPSLRYIILPALLPELLSALRVSLGLAVSVLFFAENFGTTLGMGHFIMDAQIRVNYPDLYGGILVLAAPVLLLFLLLDAAEYGLFPWRRTGGR